MMYYQTYDIDETDRLGKSLIYVTNEISPLIRLATGVCTL